MTNQSNTGNSHRAMRAARLLVLSASVIGFIGATASPAAAEWRRQIMKGTPGAISPGDYRGAEGGQCGDPTPNVTEHPTCSKSTPDANHIFINRFRVSTAPYSAYQTITVQKYLYYWDGSQWKLSSSFGQPWEKSVPWIASYSNLEVIFGSAAADVSTTGPRHPSSCPVACNSAFWGLPRGYYFTVGVVISWYDSSTNSLLAQAFYLPTNSVDTNDIGCAGYAQGTGRCVAGKDVTRTGYVYFP